MKRKLLLFCILAFAAIAVSAQNNLVIRNFKYDQYDQTANLKGTQRKTTTAGRQPCSRLRPILTTSPSTAEVMVS